MAPGPARGSGYKPAGMPRSTPGGSPGGSGIGRSGSGSAPSWQWGTNQPSPNKGVAPRTQSYKGRGNPYKGNSSPTTQPGGAPRPSTPEAKRQARQQARNSGTNGASKRGAKGSYRANPLSKNAANKAAPTAKAAQAAGAAGIPAAAAKTGISRGAAASAGSRRLPVAAAAAFGLATGEGLRRDFAKNNPDLQYPSNTPALLGDPAGTIRDGARGLREAWREPGQTLRQGWEGLNNSFNDRATRQVQPSGITEGTPDGYTTPGPPPFTGGQSPGVAYEMNFSVRNINRFTGAVSESPTRQTGQGPIGGVTKIVVPAGSIDGFPIVAISYRVSFADGEKFVLLGGASSRTIYEYELPYRYLVSTTGVNRLDGQPDTGGDPPGLPMPINPPTPVRAPAPPTPTPTEPETPTESPPQPRPPAPELPGRPPSRQSPPQTTPPETPPETQPPTQPAKPPQPVIPDDPQGVPTSPDRDSEQDPKTKPPTDTAPFIPPLPARGSNGPTRTRFQRPGRSSPPTGTSNPPAKDTTPVKTTSPPGCRGCGGSLSNSIGDINAGQANIINNIGQPTDLSPVLANQVVMMASDATVLQRLGAQVTGGIGPFMETAFKATRLDKVLNALNTLLIIHNGLLLSRSFGSTMAELASSALNLFGIKDEKDQPIDVAEVLGDQFENFLKGIVGEETYNQVSGAWRRGSAILNSAAQIVWTVRSIGDSAAEIAGWTAENTGKIGNALKAWRIVGPNAYKWMPERVTQQDAWSRKVSRFRDFGEALEDAASSLSSVIGEGLSIQDEMKELKDQKDNFDKALKEAIPQDRVDNDATKARADTSKTASASPLLEVGDRKRGGET